MGKIIRKQNELYLPTENSDISRRSFIKYSTLCSIMLLLDWQKLPVYAKRTPPDKLPVVIIGAGLGGLCCGAFLAKNGFPVTVIEQHNGPGGYATSFSRQEEKYNFEVSLHGTSINNNAAARLLGELGILDNLDLVQLSEVYVIQMRNITARSCITARSKQYLSIKKELWV